MIKITSVLLRLAVSVLLFISMTSCHDNDVIDDNEMPISEFTLGADVSWLTEMESNGHRFHDVGGRENDCISLLKSYGISAVRLRVWVNPAEHGEWCDKYDVLAKALRAEAQGMDIMIDFHYSDWWADPSKQNIPAEWCRHTYEELKTDVARHTSDVLQLLKDNHITPKWVQIGNETRNGFLWPVGQADKHPEQYAGLFMSGHDAVKKIFPDTKVIVHLDNGADYYLYEWNLNILRKYGAHWDIIGTSVYPYWSMMSGRYTSEDEVINKSVDNIKFLGMKYGCDVMIVETGMECADDNGRLADDVRLEKSRCQLLKLLKSSRDNTNGYCNGVFYWEPECTPSAYRLGAFTEDGRPTKIMDAFREL